MGIIDQMTTSRQHPTTQHLPATHHTIDPIRIAGTDWLTLRDAATCIDVPYERVKAWRAAGRIGSAAELDGRWYVRLDHVQAVMSDLRVRHAHTAAGIDYVSPELAGALLQVHPRRVYDWNRSRKLPGTIRGSVGNQDRMWVLLDECRAALAGTAGRGRPRTRLPTQRTVRSMQAGMTWQQRRHIQAATG